MQLQGIAEELQSLHQDLTGLIRTRALGNLLRIVIIGFFILRHIDRKAYALGKTACERLDSFGKQISEIKKSDSYLSEDDEKPLLNLLGSLEMDLNYLGSIKALDEIHHSAAINEIQKLRSFVTNYNIELKKERQRQELIRLNELEKQRQELIRLDRLEKEKLRQELIGLKTVILQAEKEFSALYDSQRYFPKRQLRVWKKTWSRISEPIERFLKKGTVSVDFQRAVIRVSDVFQHGEQLVEKRNADFIEKEIVRFKDYFDRLESYPLTDDQRRAIVVDEESCLIVAGAGTGKTSTIIGKAGYLIEKGLAAPEEILLIAFNKDVASEMSERALFRLKRKLNARTYHSLGLEVISQSEGVKPSVTELASDRVKLPKKISEFIRNRSTDENFSRMISNYFLFHFSPYKSMFEFNSWGEYIEYLIKFDIRSLKGDIVKSFEECDIANFLYINGIDYEYEKRYEVKTADIRYMQYKPDFFLPEYGLYIEHFGIDRKGKTAPYVAQVGYNKEIKWKRDIHRDNETTLVETYSYEKQEGKLLSNLEEKLHAKGVVLNPIPSSQIFDKLNELGKVDSLSLLLSTFLNLYKSCGKTLDEIRNNAGSEDDRTRTFLEIFSRIYDDYTAYIEETEEIDFNDMINAAESLVRQRKFASKFKYILVDEFQDISQSRYRFLKSLLGQNRAHLFCVGDDWQSIYRFTGSDLSIMLDFAKNLEFSEKNYLVETFRFNDKLCDFSTKFILKNPNQIEKRITSRKKGDKPAVTLIKGETKSALTNAIGEIDQRRRSKESVFIIGRYNYLEPENLGEISEKYPELEITFTTAHSSKGLEADNVILIGLASGEYGFPCQIVDDPILNLVLAKQDLFANAEERRLFYVAITRARKHVYLVGGKFWASTFLSEIQQGGYEIEVVGDDVKALSCPVCKTGKIIPRKGKHGEFHSCSNYPYCEYMPRNAPSVAKGFCMRRHRGILVQVTLVHLVQRLALVAVMDTWSFEMGSMGNFTDVATIQNVIT